MYRQRGGTSAGERLGMRLDGKITLKDESNIDAFNSNYGPYGMAGNYGSGALVTTNAIGTNDVHLEKKAYIRGDVFVGPVGNPDMVIGGTGLIYGRQDVLTKNYTMPDDAVMPDDTAGYLATKDLTGAVTLTGDVNDDDDAD